LAENVIILGALSEKSGSPNNERKQQIALHHESNDQASSGTRTNTHGS